MIKPRIKNPHQIYDYQYELYGYNYDFDQYCPNAKTLRQPLKLPRPLKTKQEPG
ncbi:MAG: hypothetical protein GX228_01970 [Firmicutes bacterium]|jgi:hypothetical protein|nr:hypothetical protein [Bacillota bacterium]NLL87683.1 hypothetical protein [Bacillota bacterium]HKM16686.1 hypothetical protein [Limnochordia bacterium]